MKQRKSRLVCLLLAGMMLLGLAACGKDKPKDTSKDTPPQPTEDHSLLTVGPYELRYKDAKILETSDGKDLLILTLDFTNNSKETISYLWAVLDWAEQDGADLDYAHASIYDLYAVTESQDKEVAPGKTVEIQSAFILADPTKQVKVSFEELGGGKSDTITIDPSSFSREPASGGTQSPAQTGEALLDWWNGDWYGWWTMNGCWGGYEELEGQRWDICGTIDIDEDYTGTVELWDEDYGPGEVMAAASVTLNEAGVGTHGTIMSESGWFSDMALEHADWIVDPGLMHYEDMICIDGYYENGEDEFHYEIYLRPWGTRWDDVDPEDTPKFYHDWYLPLIGAGEPMPDTILGD